jgi:hypothetical protein
MVALRCSLLNFAYLPENKRSPSKSGGSIALKHVYYQAAGSRILLGRNAALRSIFLAFSAEGKNRSVFDSMRKFQTSAKPPGK